MNEEYPAFVRWGFVCTLDSVDLFTLFRSVPLNEASTPLTEQIPRGNDLPNRQYQMVNQLFEYPVLHVHRACRFLCQNVRVCLFF